MAIVIVVGVFWRRKRFGKGCNDEAWSCIFHPFLLFKTPNLHYESHIPLHIHTHSNDPLSLDPRYQTILIGSHSSLFTFSDPWFSSRIRVFSPLPPFPSPSMAFGSWIMANIALVKRKRTGNGNRWLKWSEKWLCYCCLFHSCLLFTICVGILWVVMLVLLILLFYCFHYFCHLLFNVVCYSFSFFVHFLWHCGSHLTRVSHFQSLIWSVNYELLGKLLFLIICIFSVSVEEMQNCTN